MWTTWKGASLCGRRSALKYLDLSRNGLGDEDVALLLEGILDNNQCLEILHNS